MFAHQSDVIIRSDIKSAKCIFQFLVTVVACHKYTIVIFNVRRTLLLPGIYHPIHLPA